MSLVPGFEYDIFISYRHNDNRSGWVTDFVNALQEELAATIKESLTIYFDKNPHDGLLETHNVDKSLEGKLKCLIFIPIVSQTYCDPKSFAWQQEFVAFNKLAQQDQVGRDIKLSNGNVASRILPVKIHDLDAEDKSIIENEIGGTLRSVDFIYKEPGVNRPLKATDSKTDNQNKTDYKNQVNKVANAIKEIISAIKNPTAQASRVANSDQLTTERKNKKSLIAIGASVLGLLIIGYFLYPKLFSTNGTEVAIGKSIAVLPFVDMSPDHDQEYFGDGVAEEIINVLAQSQDLKVIARTSSFQFKGKNEDLKKVGELLGVTTVLEGSIRKSSDQIRITAQLIKTADGTHVWSKTFDRPSKDVFAVQDEIAQAVAAALRVSLSEHATSATEIAWNEEAKKEYQLGRYYFGRFAEGDYDLAFKHFKNSIAIDSSSAIVYPFLYITCNEPREQCKKYLDKGLKINPNLPEALMYNSFWHLFQYDFIRAREEINKALKYGPHNPIVLRSACRVMSMLGNHQDAIRMGEEALSLDPLLTYSYLNLSEAYARAGNYEDAIRTLKKSRDISKRMDDELVALYLLNNQTEDAIQNNEKTAVEDKDFNEILIQFKLNHKDKATALLNAFTLKGKDENKYRWRCAQANAFIGNRDLAFDWLEKSFNVRSSYLVRLSYDPLLSSLHSDPRFNLLLNKMAFPKE